MVVIKTTGGTDAIRVSGITIKERRGPASTSTTATTKPVTVYKTISVLVCILFYIEICDKNKS